MKLWLALIVASLALVAVNVQADEFPEPITFEIGARRDGDALVDMYYAASEPTTTPGTHSVTINWDYTDINFIRIYAYADNADYEYTGLPADRGTITVTSEDVNQLEVSAYLYGPWDDSSKH